MTARVVINDCAGVAGAVAVRWKPAGPALPPNWRFAYQGVADRCPNVLTGPEQDWLEVFGALYAIDRVCPRDEGTTTGWNRDIEAWLPVRDVDRWQAAEPLLRNLFSLLTGDRLSVRFVAELAPVPPPKRTGGLPRNPTTVALLSGGLDSATAVAGIVDGGGRPITVSHESNTAAVASVKAVRAGLRLPVNGHCKISSGNRPNSGLLTQESQRARSALYISTAVLLAHAWGLPSVAVGENGVMAVHLPATEARLGSLSTKTAHPEVLDLVGRLAAAALEAQVAVDNPLEHLTKAEVVARLSTLGHGPLVPATVSCWNSHTTQHCGVCVPCVQRAIATETAGVADGGYAQLSLDVLPSVTEGAATAHDNLVHLKTLAQDVADSDDAELVYAYPELLVSGGRVVGADRIRLYRRWSDEALSVFAAHPYSARL